MSDKWQLKAVLSANSAGMIKALTEAGKVAKTTRKYLLDVGKAAGNFTGRIGLPVSLLSGLAAGFSFAAIKNAVTGLADLEDEVSKFSATTGIAGAEFKRFQYLAKLSNVPFENMTASLAKLNKGIYDAGSGKNKSLAALFTRLNIPLRDANGQLRSAATLIPELADAFKRNDNAGVRSAMGTAMFGKQWREIMPLLADGSKKINERMARFKELGLEVSDVEAFDRQMEAAGRFGDKLDDLSFVSKGFQNTIANGLIPVLDPLINKVIKWVVANKDLVAVEVKAFVRDLVDGLRQVDWQGIIQGARDFGAGLGKVVDFVGGTKNALIALAVVMNLQTISAFFGLIGAAVRLVWYLGVMTVTAIPKAIIAMGLYTPATTAAAAATTGLAVATDAANAAALGWLGSLKAVLGVLGSIAAAAAPLAVMWGVKNWAEDQSNDQGRVSAIQGFASMLPFNRDASIEAIRQRNRAELGGEPPSLVGQSGRVKADGKIDININGLPQGTRVDQKPAGDIPLNVNAGYRSDALGMVW